MRGRSPGRAVGWKPPVSSVEQRIAAFADELRDDIPAHNKAKKMYTKLVTFGDVKQLGVLPAQRNLPTANQEQVLVEKGDTKKTWEQSSRSALRTATRRLRAQW